MHCDEMGFKIQKQSIMKGNSNIKGGIPRVPKLNHNEMEQNPLYQQFKKVMNLQERKFKIMNVHCDQLEKYVQNLQNMLQVLNSKLQNYFQNKDVEEIHTLKDKQNSFIIEELNLKIKKLIRKENDLSDQLTKSKTQITRLEEVIINYKREHEDSNNLDIQELTQQLNQKNAQIQELNRKINSLLNSVPKMQVQPDPSKNKLNQVEYQELSNKLKEIESEMSEQIEELKKKNNELLQQTKVTKEQKQKNESKSKALIYQLEIKLKQQKKITLELQEAHNMLLAKSSDNQISMHQQIMTLKKNLNDQKKFTKSIKKQYQQSIHQIAKILLEKTLIFHSTKVSEQLQEFAKEIQKQHKKNITNLKQTHNLEITNCNQELERKAKAIQALQQQLKAQKLHENTNNGQGQNNSFNKGSQKGQGNDQKYKTRLETLKKDAKAKQTRIYEMQEELDTQFNQSTEKLLKMEQEYLVKNNECRKKEQQIGQLIGEIQNIKRKLQITQKLKDDLKAQHHNNKIAIETSWKQKIIKLQATLQTVKTSLKQSQSKQQQLTSKLNKMKVKSQKQQKQMNEIIKLRTQKVEELTKKLQALTIQNKLNSERIKFEQQNKVQSRSVIAPANTDLIQHIQQQRDKALEDYQIKVSEYNNLENQSKNLFKKMKRMEQNLEEQKVNGERMRQKYEVLKLDYESMKSELKDKIANGEKQHHSAFIQLKKQYEKINQGLKMSQKNLQKKKKEYQEAIKSRDKYKSQATNYKSQIDKSNNKINQLEYIMKQRQTEKEKIIEDLNLKISEQNIKVIQLVKIANNKNNNDDSMRDSIQGQRIVQIIPKVQTKDIGINTDQDQKITKPNSSNLQDDSLPRNNKSNHKKPQNSQQRPSFKGNLFLNLGLNDDVNNFQICEQGQQINIGQTSQNLRIKQLFNKLRLQIQKIFNGEEASLSILRILPPQLQDDYNEFLSYIKEKINQIKQFNDISFINVIIGNQPDCSQASLDLPDLVSRNTEGNWKKIIQQKQVMIHSLMAYRTQQQNTINQLTMEKQDIEEENENRFMNQCNIYKKQIKEHKKTLDILEMNYQSIKNLLKNICDIWISEEDMEQDLRDNMELYAKVAKLNEKQRSKLNLYIVRYKEIRGFTD